MKHDWTAGVIVAAVIYMIIQTFGIGFTLVSHL